MMRAKRRGAGVQLLTANLCGAHKASLGLRQTFPARYVSRYANSLLRFHFVNFRLGGRKCFTNWRAVACNKPARMK
jgi:hypothetical protein